MYKQNDEKQEQQKEIHHWWTCHNVTRSKNCLYWIKEARQDGTLSAATAT